MKQVNWICALLLLVLAVSCEKEEKPYTISLVRSTVQIPMGTNYANDFYYNLADTSIVAQSPRDSWDLAFSSTPDGFEVYLNSAKLMYAYNTGSTNFDSIFTYQAYRRRWDNPTGNGTAIGDWRSVLNTSVVSAQQVYLVDRGSNVAEQAIGHKKVMFGDMLDGKYSVTFANLDGSDQHTVELAKVDDHNFVYLSFDNEGKQVQVAPTNNTWDVRFVMYTNIFTTDPGGGIPFAPGDTIPYLVNGVMLNPNGVTAAQTSDILFNDLEYAHLGNLQFSSDLDVIGWDWKSFTLSDEGYAVDTSKVFVVKDLNDTYFKLRFIDFYSDLGEKGYPTFELKQLQ